LEQTLADNQHHYLTALRDVQTEICFGMIEIKFLHSWRTTEISSIPISAKHTHSHLQYEAIQISSSIYIQFSLIILFNYNSKLSQSRILVGFLKKFIFFAASTSK
jgi:hypothetical protein